MRNIFYYPLRELFLAIGYLPLPVLYIISDMIFFLAFYVTGYRKPVVFENLKNSFPEKKPEEIRIIARKFYRHLCDLIVETLYLSHMGEQEIKKRVRFNNPEVVEQYFREGKHVAAVMGHYANWEWLSGFPLITGFRCISVYRSLKNKFFDRLMYDLRSRFGTHLVPMKMVIRTLYEMDSKGVPTVTAFMADQSPPREKALYWVDFLNQDTPVYTGVERIAKRLDMAVVYFRMNKLKRGYYEIDFIPLSDQVNGVPDNHITNIHVNALEKHIRERPELWLWSHRRWKIKR